MIRFTTALAATISIAMLTAGAAAQNSTAFTYNGQLKENGAPANGGYDMTFSLWDALSNGNQVGSTVTIPGVPIADGLFTVQLDFGAAAFDNSNRWLQVVVDSTTLVPRQPITRAPYAIQTRGVFVDDSGNVGIGTNSPDIYRLRVAADSFAVLAEGGSYGVFGSATANTPFITVGVYGESYGTSGMGVRGEARAQSGTTFGGSFISYSTSGSGVEGRAYESSGQTFGVHGRASSPAGFAVYGLNDAASAGVGVYGYSSAISSVNYGVIGHSNSAAGFDFYAAGAGQNYGSSSSIRWKRNVAPIEDPLEKLSRLRGVLFDWDAEHGGHHDIGMIAEEVGAVLPEIVQYEANGIDAIGMDYSKLAPLLVEAVNALQRQHGEQLDDQAAWIADLEAENQALRARLGALEQLVTQVASDR